MLAKMIDEVREAAEQIRGSRHVTDEDRSVIHQQLQELVRTSMPEEVLNNIDKKYGGTIRNEVVSTFLEEHLSETQSRLKTFQNDLSKKAAAALAWGLATAAIGIFFLWLLIAYGTPPPVDDRVVGVFYYTMRIGFVGLIELIAFFFLRQYRLTLLDVKYVNNEITNVEMRLMAAASARHHHDDEGLVRVGKDRAQLRPEERGNVYLPRRCR